MKQRQERSVGKGSMDHGDRSSSTTPLVCPSALYGDGNVDQNSVLRDLGIPEKTLCTTEAERRRTNPIFVRAYAQEPKPRHYFIGLTLKAYPRVKIYKFSILKKNDE